MSQEELQEQPHDEEVEAQEPTSEPEQEAAPEQEEAQEQASEQRQVPLAALHEERARRRELDQQLQAVREQNVRMEERFRAFQERLQEQQHQATPQAPNEPTVSYEDDPAEYLRQHNEILQRQVRELQGARGASEQERQAQVAMQQFSEQLSNDERRFAAQQQDYYDAVEYLKQSRVQELQAVGVSMPEIQRAIINDTIYLAQQAARTGKSPPQAFYELARARGYTGKTPQQASAPNRTVQRVADGQRRASGMGASGGDTGGDLTLAKLANMSDEEFEKATSGERWAKLWGG